MNVPAIAQNLTRKAFVRAWGLRRPFVRWQSRRERMREKWAAVQAEIGLEQEIERLTDSGDPIVVGPWLSEVGYEALYWVPFVRWFKQTYRVNADQLLVVSRGGAGTWYADITPNRFEAFDHVTPEAFASYHASRIEGAAGTAKQLDMPPFERDLVERARSQWGARRVQVLHPSLMYRLFQQFWAGHRALSFLDDHTSYRMVTPPSEAEVALGGLPAGYVAVKFYAAQSLQDAPDTRRVLQQLLDALSERHPLVMLDTGLSLDDHGEFAFRRTDRIVSAREWMTPRNNLAVQSRIIANARAFVGTCGSIAWLAPMLGTDTTAVMTDAKFLNVHLHVARRVYRVLGAARFVPFDLGSLAPLGLELSSGRVTA